MSQEKRDLLDSLVLRAPAVGTAFTAGLVRLKLGSPLRRRLMAYAVARGFRAMARSDIDVNVLLYEPDTEVWMHGMDSVGVGGCFRGREGVRRSTARSTTPSTPGGGRSTGWSTAAIASRYEATSSATGAAAA